VELDEYRRMADAESGHWWYGTTRALLTEVLGPELSQGSRFLDAGGGTGATGAWMTGYGTVVAVDAEPLALALYGECHPDVTARAVADIASLPLASEAFDAVLCVTVLCHRLVASPAAAVGELVRVTRPGGVVCLVEPGVARLRRAHDRVTHTARRFSRAELAGLLEASGCDVVRSTGAYSFLVPPAAAKAVLERGRTASDLDRGRGGLGGVLPAVAALERVWLRRAPLPFGLSVLAIGRRRPATQRPALDRPAGTS